MKLFGYYVGGKNYGVGKRAEQEAIEAAKKIGFPVVRKIYKV